MQNFKNNLVITKKIFFVLCLLFCATPFANNPIALIIGFLFACILGNPFAHISHKATKWLLKICVVGLGFGMSLQTAIHTSKQGLILTVCSIVITLGLGIIIGKLLKISTKIAHLLASGTAICGGSAIAAVAPIVNASEKEISVSLGTVFLLNSIALIIFPAIGHFFNLTQHQFGLWSAIAIHDTSSVVGAASSYGQEALQLATTVKLARALWIIPLSLVSAFVFKSENKKINIPWFIGLFILAMIMNSYIPYISNFNTYIVSISKTGLTITLFLIGVGLSINKIKSVGWKPLLLGVLLWIVISVSSLFAIMWL